MKAINKKYLPEGGCILTESHLCCYMPYDSQITLLLFMSSTGVDGFHLEQPSAMSQYFFFFFGGGGGHCNPVCTFQWEKHKNDVFHVLVSKYLQICVLCCLFWWKPCLDVLSYLSQPQNYTFSSQNGENPWFWWFLTIFVIFDMTLVMTSQSRHTWGCWYLFGING